MQKTWKCQRCGQKVSDEERKASGKIASFNDGLCLLCLEITEAIRAKQEKSDYPQIRTPINPPADGWWLIANLADYQNLFDQISVEYNCLVTPDSFPAAGYLYVGGVADSCGAWFTYMYPEKAAALCRLDLSINPRPFSLGEW